MGWNQISGKVSRKRVSRYDGVPVSGSALYSEIIFGSTKYISIRLQPCFKVSFEALSEFILRLSLRNLVNNPSVLCIVNRSNM